MTKIMSIREVIKEALKEQRTVLFATLMEICICHLKSPELEPKYENTEAGLYSEVTLWKTILALMRYSQSRVRQHHK